MSKLIKTLSKLNTEDKTRTCNHTTTQHINFVYKLNEINGTHTIREFCEYSIFNFRTNYSAQLFQLINKL